MEAMEDDSVELKDDHNHNYCASSSSSKVRLYLSSQLSAPQPVCAALPGGEPGTRRGKQRSGSSSTAAGSKFMDSDSGSESSEVSETDCSAAPAAVEGKFTLDSTSKFRKLVFLQGLRSCSRPAARPRPDAPVCQAFSLLQAAVYRVNNITSCPLLPLVPLSFKCNGRRRLPEKPLAKPGEGDRPSADSEPHRPHLCVVCTDIQVSHSWRTVIVHTSVRK